MNYLKRKKMAVETTANSKNVSHNLVVAKINNTIKSSNIVSVISVNESKLSRQTPNSYNQIQAYLKVNLESGKTYTLSFESIKNYIKDIEYSNSTLEYSIRLPNGTKIVQIGSGEPFSPKTFTIPQNAPNELSFFINIINSYQGGNRKIIFEKLMINEGLEPLPFEPYATE